MRESDLAQVMTIAAALKDAPHWPREAYETALASEESHRTALRRVALVAEVNGCAAGFAIASVLADEAELESIAVEEQQQKTGIGSLLLEAITAAMRDNGARLMRLEVRESNAAAQRLYARAGFRAVGRRRGYYDDPKEDAVLLELRLAPAGV
jgi:[ribosomal protein S18]-alanine N-acetyltransferase